MKTTVDWLTFRTKSDPFAILEEMRVLVGSAGDLLTLRTGGKGMDGWLRSCEILLAGDVTLGRIDYDGESQRDWVRVNLTGEGCGWVEDWSKAFGFFESIKEADIRRLDIALTTYQGETSHDQVLAAYARGGFCAGGRPPKTRIITGSDPRDGRTIYVGTRKGSHKMLRCYEKGFELLTKVPESIRNQITHIEGHQVDQMYRVELELKATDDKVIPWTAIDQRDQVFAGAYPYCSEVMPGVPGYVIQSMPDFGPRVDLERSLDHCRKAYGAILRAAVMAHDGDAMKVFQRVLSVEPSRALIDAGVLTCSHL